jgi:hypothetical protein
MAEANALSDFRNDPWLAGFADGEACFSIMTHPGGYLSPRFQIALRDDDGELLKTLRDAFGGRIYHQQPSPSTPAGSRPQYHWFVLRKADLAHLADYFERFPLRSKKSRDCATWCQAVRVFCATNGRDHRLTELRTSLMDGRAYERGNVEEPPASAQMELAA